MNILYRSERFGHDFTKFLHCARRKLHLSPSSSHPSQAFLNMLGFCERRGCRSKVLVASCVCWELVQAHNAKGCPPPRRRVVVDCPSMTVRVPLKLPFALQYSDVSWHTEYMASLYPLQVLVGTWTCFLKRGDSGLGNPSFSGCHCLGRHGETWWGGMYHPPSIGSTCLGLALDSD